MVCINYVSLTNVTTNINHSVVNDRTKMVIFMDDIITGILEEETLDFSPINT